MGKHKNHNTDDPIYSLLAPDSCALVMVDFQPQMAFATKSIDGQMLINNALDLAKSAKIFSIPTIFTTIGEKRFAGPMFPQIKVFPGQQMIDRTTMNCWEDDRVVSAFKKTGRKSLYWQVCAQKYVLQCLLSKQLKKDMKYIL
jgi:nicotinamidase-related amidase